MPDYYGIARSVRNAIEGAVRNGEPLPELARFPHGCCSFASDILQRYFCDHNIFTWYISGSYGYGWTKETHAWLETEDGTVIDITGDQYRDKKPQFTVPVYVGPKNDGFHEKFKEEVKTLYSIIVNFQKKVPLN